MNHQPIFCFDQEKNIIEIGALFQQAKMDNLLDLPDVILLKLLQNLPINDILNLRSTCSHLFKLSRNREFFERVVVNVSNLSLDNLEIIKRLLEENDTLLTLKALSENDSIDSVIPYMANIKELSINKKYLETICTHCKNIKKLSVDLGPFDIYEKDSFVVDVDFTCLSKLTNLAELVIGAESSIYQIPLDPRILYDILSSIITVSKFTLHKICIKRKDITESHPDDKGHPDDEELTSSLQDLITGLSNIEHWSLVDLYCQANIFKFPTSMKSLKCVGVSCQNFLFLQCQHRILESTDVAEFVGESIKYPNLRVLHVTGDLPGECRLLFCPHLEILELRNIQCIYKFQLLFHSNLKKVTMDTSSLLNTYVPGCFISNCDTLQELIIECDWKWDYNTIWSVPSALRLIFNTLPKLKIELHRFFEHNVTLTLENFDLFIKEIEFVDVEFRVTTKIIDGLF